MSQPPPQCIMETDASTIGWGVFWEGEATDRCWSVEEQELHINEQELLAVFLVLKSFLKETVIKAVLIKSDSMAVVAHINKFGGTKSHRLVTLSKQIFGWCMQREIRVIAQHLPGKVNTTADYLSRYLRDRKYWILNPEIFQGINNL